MLLGVIIPVVPFYLYYDTLNNVNRFLDAEGFQTYKYFSIYHNSFSMVYIENTMIIEINKIYGGHKP